MIPTFEQVFTIWELKQIEKHLVYSLIEGISFGLYDNYQALSKTGIKLNNLFVIGGGSKNKDWIKLISINT